MADDIGGVWRTIGGRRVFIKDGQDLKQAMKASGKFKSKEDTKFQDNYKSIEKAADMLSNEDKPLTDKAKEFYNKLGYTDKPKIVNKNEFEKIKNDTKYGVLEKGYRGNDEQEIENYINQFKNGELYIGIQRAFGSGTYFGYGNDAHPTALKYGQYNEKYILKATIGKDTKIITTKNIDKKREEFRAKAFEEATKIAKTKGNQAANEYYKKIKSCYEIRNERSALYCC